MIVPRLSRSMPYFSARKISLSFTDLQHAKMFCDNKMPASGKIILKFRKFQGQHSYKEYSYKSKQNLLSCLLLRYVLLGSVHYCSCLFLLIFLAITKTKKKKKT